MRNFKKIFTFILALSIIFTACNKEVNELKEEKANVEFDNSEVKNIDDISTYLNNYHTEKGPLRKIRAWIRAHTGTHIFNNCTGSYACGPCAGLCLYLNSNSIVVGDDYELSEDEIQEGFSLLELVLIDDGLGKVVVSFNVTDDFVINDNLYIPEDIDLGPEVATEFEKRSFILKKGLYPVSYQYNNLGETVLDIK